MDHPQLVNSSRAVVLSRPPCEFCGEPAHFDGKTQKGPWVYMCGFHFTFCGRGLGHGRGQRLVTPDELEGGV